jgi:hypothetical protein
MLVNAPENPIQETIPDRQVRRPSEHPYGRKQTQSKFPGIENKCEEITAKVQGDVMECFSLPVTLTHRLLARNLSPPRHERPSQPIRCTLTFRFVWNMLCYQPMLAARLFSN